METLEDGTVNKNYIPRTDEELSKFEGLVKSAMGYNEDREDQVSVTSFPFSQSQSLETVNESMDEGNDIIDLLINYRNVIINLVLVALVFLIIIRPLLKSLKNVAQEASTQVNQITLQEELAKLPEKQEVGNREKAIEISKSNPDKANQLLRGWMNE